MTTQVVIGAPKHGIETLYNGVRFRSRLEARWAAFFDALCWRWEYEPFDCAGYIPDFLLLIERPIVVDVKPIATGNELRQRARVVFDLLPDHHPVIAVGVSRHIVGLEYTNSFGAMLDEHPPKADTKSSSEAWISVCPKCAKWGIYNTDGAFAPDDDDEDPVPEGKFSRVCGHFAEHWYDPGLMGNRCRCAENDHCSHGNEARLDAAWARAIDEVRWIAKGNRP